MDFLIPIVYPDYLVNTEIKAVGRLPLGHAGILLIQHPKGRAKKGLTKYFEYGRYDLPQLGLTRRIPIPDVAFGPHLAAPELASLGDVLSFISRKAGHGGRIRGVLVSGNGLFAPAWAYAARREKDNHNAKRKPYSLWSNSCAHFVTDVLVAAGVPNVPTVSSLWPSPDGYMDDLRKVFRTLDADPPDFNVQLGPGVNQLVTALGVVQGSQGLAGRLVAQVDGAEQLAVAREFLDRRKLENCLLLMVDKFDGAPRWLT